MNGHDINHTDSQTLLEPYLIDLVNQLRKENELLRRENEEQKLLIEHLSANKNVHSTFIPTPIVSNSVYLANFNQMNPMESLVNYNSHPQLQQNSPISNHLIQNVTFNNQAPLPYHPNFELDCNYHRPDIPSMTTPRTNDDSMGHSLQHPYGNVSSIPSTVNSIQSNTSSPESICSSSTNSRSSSSDNIYDTYQQDSTKEAENEENCSLYQFVSNNTDKDTLRASPKGKRKLSQLVEVRRSNHKKHQREYDSYIRKFTLK